MSHANLAHHTRSLHWMYEAKREIFSNTFVCFEANDAIQCSKCTPHDKGVDWRTLAPCEPGGVRAVPLSGSCVAPSLLRLVCRDVLLDVVPLWSLQF